MALDNKLSEILSSTNETLSKVENAVKASAIDEKDSAVLEILKSQDPETYQKYLVRVERAASLSYVMPGDLITARMINALIDRINALEDGGESVLRLGPLAQQAHTLVALGGTLASGAGLWLDGVRLLDKSNEVANLVLLDGSSLEVRLALVAEETKGELAIEQLMKAARKGDVLMAQMVMTEKPADTGEAAVNVTTSLIHTYIGMIQENNDFMSALYFLNSIQAGHLPFTWALYSTKLKRFVLGGASEDYRLQQYVIKTRLNG